MRTMVCAREMCRPRLVTRKTAGSAFTGSKTELSLAERLVVFATNARGTSAMYKKKSTQTFDVSSLSTFRLLLCHLKRENGPVVCLPIHLYDGDIETPWRNCGLVFRQVNEQRTQRIFRRNSETRLRRSPGRDFWSTLSDMVSQGQNTSTARLR